MTAQRDHMEATMSTDRLRDAAKVLREAGEGDDLAAPLADWLDGEAEVHDSYDCHFLPCPAMAAVGAILGGESS